MQGGQIFYSWPNNEIIIPHLSPAFQIKIQSSEAANQYSQSHRIENAYDDNVNTIYAPPDNVGENWVKFNLRSLNRITRVVVINRIDCCFDLLNNTEVNVVDTAIQRTSLCGVIDVDEETGEDGTYTIDCKGLVGDRLMMTDRDVSARATLSFAEIDIYGIGRIGK